MAVVRTMPSHERSITVSAGTACEYLKQYCRWYREEYDSFVSAPPEGGGYPALPISPYLDSPHIQCWLCDGGYALADIGEQPASAWQSPHSAGFPVWSNIITSMPDEVRAGILPGPIDTICGTVDDTRIAVYFVNLSLPALIERLTLGHFKSNYPADNTPFWHPTIFRNFGFTTSDLDARRYFKYFEYAPHVEHAAWDLRTIPVRVRVDVRRDFAHTYVERFFPGGTIDFESRERGWAEHFINAIHTLTNTVAQFRRLLDTRPDADEREIHEYLREHPELLDLYASDVESKPAFKYPPSGSPLGKEYVEPDFLLTYPGPRYALVEIERPGKKVATQQGQPRSEVNQAVFQLAEWRTYIQAHSDELKDRYPGIETLCRYVVIIGRDVLDSFAGKPIQGYKRLVQNTYNVDEVLTYDDLLAKCDAALARLSALPH